jgi:hypothetical protein
MKYLSKYFSVITVILTVIVYLTTIAPSTIQIDSGELAAVQITLGIAHPTGYPLYTLLGYLFSNINLFDSKIFQMNFLAMIYVSLAVMIFTITVKFILDNLNYFRFESKQIKKKNNQKNIKEINLTEFEKIFLSVITGLILAFSKTIWFQSTSVEVYSLQILLFSLIISLLIKSFISSNNKHYWLMFSFFLALGFTNHMTTLLIIPATAYLFFSKNKLESKLTKQLVFMILIFIITIILIYVYLPLRAAQNPILNWGNPIDLERLLRHVSGFQYQVWLFTSMDAAKKQLAYFISNLPKEFYFTIFISFIGIVSTFRYYKKFFIFNLILFLFTILYSINYDINDIDSYFILSYFSLALFSTFGLIWLIDKYQKFSKSFYIALLLLFPFNQLAFNYSVVNQSNNYIYEDYTKALLNSVPPNSIIFGYQWDYFISPSYYFQFVENYRRDVVVIDKELLRRSWYFNQIENQYPKILKGTKTEIDLFLKALKPFERKENYNSNLLESLYRRIMTNLVTTNINEREFHLTPEIIDNEMQRGEFTLPAGYDIVPYLLTFKVVKTKEYVEAPLPDFTFRIDKIKDKYQSGLVNIVTTMLLNRAIYEKMFNRYEKIKIYIDKAKDIDPNLIIPEQLR